MGRRKVCVGRIAGRTIGKNELSFARGEDKCCGEVAGGANNVLNDILL